MNWEQALALAAQQCAAQGEERVVLLVLRDASYHVKHVVGGGSGPLQLLAFEVYDDDPERSQRSPGTHLLLVPPDRVERLTLRGASDSPPGLGFGDPS